MFDHNGVDTRAQRAEQRAPKAPLAGLSLGAVLRYWPLVAALGITGAVAGYAATLVIPPRYQATAQIFIDPRGLQVLDNDVTPRQQDSNTAVNFVESQVRIITSQSVLSRVVDSERLTEDPEFVGRGGSNWANDLLRSVGMSRDTRETIIERDRLALASLAERVVARRPERTFVIDITMRANEAEKAARIANSLAQAFMDAQAAARTETARRANLALTSRLDDLRERVRVAEDRAEVFRRSNNLVGTRNQFVSEQQLTEANTQLANAQTRVAEAQARFDQVQALRGNGAAGALPEAVLSSTVAALRGQQAEARRRLSDALTEFGPRHPTVRNAEAQVRDLDRGIAEEIARIAQSARGDLDRARATEVAVQATVTRLTREVSNQSGAQVQLRELQREIDVARNLLNTFLARSRETGEFERLDVTNTRIISVAQPPRVRSFPPRGVVVAFAGLAGGGLLGLGLATLFALIGALQTSRREAEEEGAVIPFQSKAVYHGQ